MTDSKKKLVFVRTREGYHCVQRNPIGSAYGLIMPDLQKKQFIYATWYAPIYITASELREIADFLDEQNRAAAEPLKDSGVDRANILSMRTRKDGGSARRYFQHP